MGVLYKATKKQTFCTVKIKDTAMKKKFRSMLHENFLDWLTQNTTASSQHNSFHPLSTFH